MDRICTCSYGAIPQCAICFVQQQMNMLPKKRQLSLMTKSLIQFKFKAIWPENLLDGWSQIIRSIPKKKRVEDHCVQCYKSTPFYIFQRIFYPIPMPIGTGWHGRKGKERKLEIGILGNFR
jgi:hypothetical protein